MLKTDKINLITMTEPRVSIIILNWNGLEDTIECLESLKKITYPNYEVIVVDNGSAENDAQVLKERFGNYIRLIQNDRNYGFAGGVNIGMQYALKYSSPDYFLLLNNDTIVAPDFLTQMVRVAENDSSIGIVGPKVYLYGSPNIMQGIGGKSNMWTGLSACIGDREVDAGQYSSRQVVDLALACTLTKVEAINRIGLYDESYFCYREDDDYCFRARKAGYKVVYAPEAFIWHKVGHTAQRTTGFIPYYLTRNSFKFMRKHATRLQYCVFLLYFSLFRFWFATGVFLLYHRNVKEFVAFCRGVKDGILNSEASTDFYISR